jgi:dTDP-4-dehydrorhamnose 3,5-epimerase-like enzyme
MSLDNIRWMDFPNIVDSRGALTALESDRDIPFTVRRMFFLHQVQGERGGHAHRTTQQLLVPVTGTFMVDLSDGSQSSTHTMDIPGRGLYLPPMTWIRLYNFSPSAVCLVLTDRYFSDSVFLRDWKEFVAESAHDARPPGA